MGNRACDLAADACRRQSGRRLPLRQQPLRRPLLRDQRKDLYPGGLFGRGRVEGEHDESQKTARLITDYVRRGGRLGLVCDLYDRRGIAVPFFGREAKTQAIAAMIARHVGARIWMARCLRVGTESRFKIELKELRVPRTANQSDDVRWIMTAMQKQFEQWVREAPEQWGGRTGAGAERSTPPALR